MHVVRHKVLVVDDERIIADTLSQIFAADGYEARAAYDPGQATELISEWLPDLILVDIILPRMSGLDLAIFVKERFPICRVLLFSGQTATANLLEDAEARGYTFEILPKPIHPREVLEAARRILSDLPANQSGCSAPSAE